MKFRPLHDRVVIRRIEGEEKTKGGIIIPDTVKEKPQEGVNDDSPVSATLSPAPVIDACHPYSRLRAETGDLPFQMPQNG